MPQRKPKAVRDRIVELIRVPARELREHPNNWRRHPPEQRAALRGLLKEVGFADALLARRDENGELVLIDGHLRRDEMGGGDVPVLVLDVTEEEADKLLLTVDPLAAMAIPDPDRVSALLETVQSQSSGVLALLAALPKASKARKQPNPPVWEHRYDVVVACKDEAEQEQVYERLTEEGYTCRVLTL